MNRPVARFTATARYPPERIVTNADFERTLDTSDQWIRERSGNRERRYSRDDETIAYMASDAARRALADAGLGPDDLDAIVAATASPDRLLPSQASDVQAALGATNAAALDVGAACSGFLFATAVAEGLMAREADMGQMTTTETHTARKPHRCDWCWQHINIGDRYKRYRVFDCGDAATVRAHEECYEAIEDAAREEGGWVEWTPGQERPSTAYPKEER